MCSAKRKCSIDLFDRETDFKRRIGYRLKSLPGVILSLEGQYVQSKPLNSDLKPFTGTVEVESLEREQESSLPIFRLSESTRSPPSAAFRLARSIMTCR